MQRKTARNLARAALRTGIAAFFLLILDISKTLKALFDVELHLETYAPLILGLSILLFLPKVYLDMAENEENHPRYPDYSSRKGIFLLLFTGTLCIAAFFLRF